MGEAGTNDDLLQPTLQGYRAPGSGGGPPPWPLVSQFYVAFFGGPIAATWIAWWNSGRLDLPSRRRLAMLALGIVATGAGLAALAAGGYFAAGADREHKSLVRIGSRAFALALCGVFYAMQKSHDRLYQANAGTVGYSRLLGPGLLIVIVSGLVSVVLGLVAMRLWSGTP